MSRPASEAKLGALHDKLADVFSELLEGTVIGEETDEETGEVVETRLPPSAAILTAVNQFLKNNNISCVPDASNSTGKLAEKAQAREEARKARRANNADKLAAQSDVGFLVGLPN